MCAARPVAFRRKFRFKFTVVVPHPRRRRLILQLLRKHGIQTLRYSHWAHIRCAFYSFVAPRNREIAHIWLLQVRAVSAPTPTLVLSASRDTKAIAWSRPEISSHFIPSTPFHAGSRYVNAVTYLAPTPDAPDGNVEFSPISIL